MGFYNTWDVYAGPEIWRQTHGRVTHFVSSMGTTGTIMGVSRYLKEQNPDVNIVGLQPAEGASIAGTAHMVMQSSPPHVSLCLLGNEQRCECQAGPCLQVTASETLLSAIGLQITYVPPTDDTMLRCAQEHPNVLVQAYGDGLRSTCRPSSTTSGWTRPWTSASAKQRRPCAPWPRSKVWQPGTSFVLLIVASDGVGLCC